MPQLRTTAVGVVVALALMLVATPTLVVAEPDTCHYSDEGGLCEYRGFPRLHQCKAPLRCARPEDRTAKVSKCEFPFTKENVIKSVHELYRDESIKIGQNCTYTMPSRWKGIPPYQLEIVERKCERGSYCNRKGANPSYKCEARVGNGQPCFYKVSWEWSRTSERKFGEHDMCLSNFCTMPRVSGLSDEERAKVPDPTCSDAQPALGDTCDPADDDYVMTEGRVSNSVCGFAAINAHGAIDRSVVTTKTGLDSLALSDYFGHWNAMGCHPSLKKCVVTQPRLGGRCSIENNVMCGFGVRTCVPDTNDSKHGRCHGLELGAACVLGAGQCDAGLYCADPATGNGPWPGARHMSRAEAAKADKTAPRGTCRPPRKLGESCSGDWQCSTHGVRDAQDYYYTEGLQTASQFEQTTVRCNIVTSEDDEDDFQSRRRARRLLAIGRVDDADRDTPYWLVQDPMVGQCTAVNSLPIGARVMRGGEDLCEGQDTIVSEEGRCAKPTPKEACNLNRFQVPDECAPLLKESNIVTTEAADNLFGRLAWTHTGMLQSVVHPSVTKELKCCMYRNHKTIQKWSAGDRMNEFVASLRTDVLAALQSVKDKIDAARVDGDEAELQHLRESDSAVERFEGRYRHVLHPDAHDPMKELSKLCDEPEKSSPVVVILVVIIVLLLFVVAFVAFKKVKAAKSEASLATGFMSLEKA